MKKLFLIFGITGILLNSCNNEDDLQSLNGKENLNAISVTSEGYLNFPNESSFKDFILQTQKSENLWESENGILKRSTSLTQIDGFNSIASIKNAQRSLKSTNDDSEEMTLDESNVMKAEEQLADPILTEVMDTTLRIIIDGRLFKITDYGTFSAPENKSKELEEAISSFNKSLITSTETGSTTDLGNSITFTNSFGNGSSQIAISDLEESGLKAYTPDLHNGYNCSSHKWQNNSVWQNFWDKIRGKDVDRENYFSDNRRVQVNVYNVNYAFYASSGIKVKMQKKKKFLFVTYWNGTSCDKMAIGFNKVYGEMKYTNPQSFSKISMTGSTAFGTFQGTINGLASNWVFSQYKKFDLVKDWVDQIYMFLPEIKILGNTYPNRDNMNQLYNLPADQVVSFLKGQTGRIFDPIKKQIQPKDPRLAYIVWGNTTQTFDKDKSYIYGVQEYGKRESKSVRFDQSFGFSFINGAVGGFVPTEFKIKEIDCFGAAYYNGQWRGIRFTH